jgi:3-dehydroquinate synthetase
MRRCLRGRTRDTPRQNRLRFKRSGIIEGIKNGLIDQKEFIPFLEGAIRRNGDYSSQQLTDLCFKLIRSKLEILTKGSDRKALRDHS